MSNHKVWKEVSHVKPTQVIDNESVVSQSRSSASYQFNKVRFSKTRIEEDRGSAVDSNSNNVNKKALGLGSVVRAKEKYIGNRNSNDNNQNSISRQKNNTNSNSNTNNNNKPKHSPSSKPLQTSFSSLLNRQPLTLSHPSHRRLQEKMKRLLSQIKKIHAQMKSLAQGMLVGFQQIKEEMEGNLLRVVEGVVGMVARGDDKGGLKGVERVREIVRGGFETVRRNIVLPLESISRLDGLYSEVELDSIGEQGKTGNKHYYNSNKHRQPPMTPLLKANKASSPLHYNKPKAQSINSIKSSAIYSASHIISPPPSLFKLQRLNLNQVGNPAPLTKEKIRAETQRRRKSNNQDSNDPSNNYEADNNNNDNECMMSDMNEGVRPFYDGNRKEQRERVVWQKRGEGVMSHRSTESTGNIENIIVQMREILSEEGV